MRKRIIDNYSSEEISEIVADSYSFSEALRKIGYKNFGGTNHNTLQKYMDSHNIDYSHFSKQGRRGITRTFENVFCKNSTACRDVVRKWYLKGQYSEYKCSICGIDIWNDKPLTLRLDHINGKSNDNRLSNLRWVCPNCDSQLPTYCGRNNAPIV